MEWLRLRLSPGFRNGLAREARPGWARTPVLAVLSLLALVGAACGPSAAFRAGDQAAGQGDWLTAVQAYRAAAADDPNDADTRARLAGAEASLVAQTSGRVRALLAVPDVDSALVQLWPALTLLPNDPTLMADLESVRVTGLSQWGDVLGAGHRREAYEGSRRLSAAFPDDGEVSALVAHAATAYGGELNVRAAGAESAGLTALALALRLVQWSVTGDDTARQRAAALHQSVATEMAFTYHVDVDGFSPSSSLPTLARPLAVAATSGTDAPVELRASLGPLSYSESWTSSIFHQSYLAGTEWVPNPDYGALQQRIADQQRDELRAEQCVLDAQRAAHDAEVERDQHQGQADYQTYYDRWDQATEDVLHRQEDVNRQRQAINDLQRQITSVPPTVEQEIWADYPYEVREHTRWAQANLTADVTVGGARVSSLANVVSAATTDQEHEAQPIIDLPADPLVYPASDVDLAQALEDQAKAELEGQLAEVYDDERESVRVQGWSLRDSDPDRAADVLVRHALYDPGAVAPEVASWLDGAVGLTDLSLLR